ncbi:unnamed protein product [Phaeothamnion confervicola]
MRELKTLARAPCAPSDKKGAAGWPSEAPAAVAGWGSGGAEHGRPPRAGYRRRLRHRLRCERAYLDQGLEVESDTFSLLAFWRDNGSNKIDIASGAVLAKPEFPRLAKLAALYMEMDATSCEVERNFLAFANVPEDMRASMRPLTVEICTLLHLNRTCFH